MNLEKQDVSVEMFLLQLLGADVWVQPNLVTWPGWFCWSQLRAASQGLVSTRARTHAHARAV